MLVTNARSLAPKILSLISMFEENSLHFAAISESWLKDGETLDRDVIDLEHGSDLGIIYKNRPQRQAGRRVVGGGVSIVYSKSRCNFRERRMTGNKFELVAAVGRVGGYSREVAIISLYIEPRMRVADLAAMKEKLSDFILQLKTSTSSNGQGPLIFVAGDMNRRDLTDCFNDFADIEQKNYEPTRGDACLDILFSNANISQIEAMRPLVNREDVESDHKCIVFTAREETSKSFTWVKKIARKHTQAAMDEAGARLASANWHQILGDDNVDNMVSRFESFTGAMVDELFPWKTIRCRDNEKPWITDGIRRISRQKKRAYRRGKKSRRWHQLQERITGMIESSKLEYVSKMQQGGQRAYFDAIKTLSCKEKPAPWEVGNLFPGVDNPAEVADKAASYFTAISDEFEPLAAQPAQAFRRPVTAREVGEKLKLAKKPNSQVAGDLPPRIVKAHYPKLIAPATLIYNKVFATGEWPSSWKNETAVIIPKTSHPSSLSQCRNISCTNFLSKVLESFILDDLRAEIPLDPAQYGGIKGSAVDHLLVDLWEQILNPMEHGHHAIILGLDYEKAFNRLSHQACLDQIRKLGASRATVDLVRAFLTGRSVRVRLPCGTMSDPRPLMGGSPQGSILGCLLYCLTTQHINADVTGDGEMAAPDSPQSNPSSTESTSPPGLGLLEEAADLGPESPNEADPSREPTEGTPPGWIEIRDETGVVVFKYVDDSTSVENVHQARTTKHFTTSKTLEAVPAVSTSTFVAGAVEKSTEIGMRINGAKTQLLCISADNGCNSSATVMVGGHRVDSAEKMKLLGYWLGNTPDANEQFQNIRRKFRGRFWSLIHLRNAGLRAMQLFKLYCIFVRPIIETNSVIYHSMLTQYQSQEIEKMQKRVTRLCFGTELSYGQICETFNIHTLKTRRENAMRKFVGKALNNPRYRNAWFVERPPVNNNIRNRRPIVENRARTSRYKNSPLVTMQRIANDILTS